VTLSGLRLRLSPRALFPRPRLSRARPDPWPPDRPVRFVTSFNDVFYAASGSRCVETLRRDNPGYELWAYVEADDDSTLTGIEQELAALGVTTVRLADLPLLGEFLELARDVIPQQFGGDAPPEMFPGEGSIAGDVWFRKNMYRWFRKIVALDHNASRYGDVLFWLDCDCFSKAPLPLPVIEDAFGGAGVVRMRANRKHTETGLIGYDLAKPGVREVIRAMRDHYMLRSFEHYPRWDDCITLDLCLERPGAPRSRDIAQRSVGHGEVLPTTVFAAYLQHEKGLHNRKLGLVN
jgi:hypothetical protein